MRKTTMHNRHFYILDVCRMLQQGHIIRYLISVLIVASISCCAVHKQNESSRKTQNEKLVVNAEDGRFLNELFDSVRGDFDFIGKKIYLNHSLIIADYIDNLFSYSSPDDDGWHPQAKGSLYIFTPEEKDATGGIDAAIYSWMKIHVSKDDVVKRLRKQQQKDRKNRD